MGVLEYILNKHGHDKIAKNLNVSIATVYVWKHRGDMPDGKKILAAKRGLVPLSIVKGEDDEKSSSSTD